MNKGTKEEKTEKYTNKTDKVTEEVQTIRYTIKKFLELIREIFDADACHLYLINTEINNSEKEQYIRDTITRIKEAYNQKKEENQNKGGGEKQGDNEQIIYEELDEIFKKFKTDHKIDAHILKFIDVVEKGKEKNWKYDNKNRPAKYVIFNKYKKDKRNILKEGLTAYVARAGEIKVFNSPEEISQHASSASLNTNKGIIPPCQMLICFPLTNKKGDTIGVIKIENFSKGKYNYEENDDKIIEADKYLPLLVRLIESSKDHFRTNSYKELFRGMELLTDLIRIEPMILKDLLIPLIRSLKGYFLTNSCEELDRVKDILKDLKQVDEKFLESKTIERIELNLSAYQMKKIELNSLEYLKKTKCPEKDGEKILSLLENLKKIEIYEGISEKLSELKLRELLEKMSLVMINDKIHNLFNNLNNKESGNLKRIKSDISKTQQEAKYSLEVDKKIDILLENESFLALGKTEGTESYEQISNEIRRLFNILKIDQRSETDPQKIKCKEKFNKGLLDLLESIEKIESYKETCQEILKILGEKKEVICPEEINTEICNLLETKKNKEIFKLVQNLKKIKPELLDKLHCIKFKPETIENICDENSPQNPKRILSPEEINKEIYESTLHLFLVLKRNEYIGYDEILNRVSEYANDINEHLGLKGDMTRSFKEYLEEVRKHEELLLCGLNDYRDHFMHQFHVFVSGYIIINELGIDNFRSRIKDGMDYVLGKERSNFELTKSDVLRIWFLTAFYHDYAYILEKIDKELQSFFKDVLGYPFTVNFNWEQLLKRDSEFPKYLNYLVKFFASEKETNPGTLLRNYLGSIIESHDHGVLSALLLIYYNSKATQKRLNECLYAALAISLHNKPVYENLTETNKRRISFESFPIAFLLAYCDTAQAFGRLEGKDHVESSDYPVRFCGIEVKHKNSSASEKIKIIYKLEYICEQLHKIPTGDMIEKWAKDVHNVFNSEDYLFEIKYYKKDYATEYYKKENAESKKKLIYTLSFH